MSETDDLKKALNTALSRIAALESRPVAQAAPAIDVERWTMDPVGSMQRAGLPVDHISKVMVARVMGDQAPPELRTLAMMGPQVSATHALSSQFEQLRQRLEQYEARDQKQAVRTSFSALATDKTKYPLLAAAYARDPKLFDSDVEMHKGDAAALADVVEGRLKILAPALGAPQPTSTVDVDKNAQAQRSQSPAGEQGKQAHGGPIDTTPPPLPSGNKPGVFTQEEHQALKARIVAKHSRPERME